MKILNPISILFFCFSLGNIQAQTIMFSTQPFYEGNEYSNETKTEFTDTEPVYGLAIVHKSKVGSGWGHFGSMKIRSTSGSIPFGTFILRGDSAYIYLDVLPKDSTIFDFMAVHWAGVFRVAALQKRKKIIINIDDQDLGLKVKIKITRTKNVEYYVKRASFLDDYCYRYKEQLHEWNDNLEAMAKKAPEWVLDDFVVFDDPNLTKKAMVSALSNTSWVNGGEVFNIVADNNNTNDWTMVYHDISGAILRRKTSRMLAVYKKSDNWCYYTSVFFYQEYQGNNQYGNLKASGYGIYLESKINCESLGK